MTPTPIGALVVFSGGQDSTTCLAWALSRFDRVETLGFDYGQRHSIELECREAVLAALRGQRPDWAQKLGSDTLLSLAVFRQLGETALTHDVEISMTATGLPSQGRRPTVADSSTSSPGSAKPTTPATRTAATTP